MAIREAVALTDTARVACRAMIAKTKAKSRTMLHAEVGLQAERTCGGPQAARAAAYAGSTKNVAPLTTRCVDAGCAAAVSRTPVPTAHRRNITGAAAAPGRAWSGRHAPAGHARWTCRRRADTMVACERVASVSQEPRRRPCTNLPGHRGTSQPGVGRRSQRPLVSATGRTAALARHTRRLPRGPTWAERPCRPSGAGPSGRRSQPSRGRLAALTRQSKARGRHTLAWLLPLARAPG